MNDFRTTIYYTDVRRFANDIDDMAEHLNRPGCQERSHDAQVLETLRNHLADCRVVLADYLTTGDVAPLLIFTSRSELLLATAEEDARHMEFMMAVDDQPTAEEEERPF